MTCHSSLPPSVTLTRFDAWAMACCSFRLWNLNTTKPYLSSRSPLKQLSKFTTPQYEISNILLILSSRSYEHNVVLQQKSSLMSPRLYDRLGSNPSHSPVPAKLCRFREQHSHLVVISTRQPFLGSRSPSFCVHSFEPSRHQAISTASTLTCLKSIRVGSYGR